MKRCGWVAVLIGLWGGCGPELGRAKPIGSGDTGLDGGTSLTYDGGLYYGDGGVTSTDPVTCFEAETSHSYIGCDYWPTVVANNVDSMFDYTVVVANAGISSASVTVTGGASTVPQTVTVQPNQLQKIFLPWVTDLKGPDTDAIGTATALPASVHSVKGAYHLVSTMPVIVYQFNALEYKAAGGPPGKNWSMSRFPNSFTNDASLLLPSSAMTGNYRVMGFHGWNLAHMNTYFAVTATKDATNITIKLAANADVIAGGGILASTGGKSFSFTLDAGDVMEIAGGSLDTSDLSGSLVQADKPVQVIAGDPCTNNPLDKSACDHLEANVFPAETLGKDYVVTVPTGPNGIAIGHTVRIYGNVDGTKLTFDPAVAGAPATINAGQVVDLGQVSTDFQVTGDHEFGVGTFQLGGDVVDPQPWVIPGVIPPTTPSKGDPSQSFSTAVEQYRTKYVFLAPDDYPVSYVDVAAPTGAALTLDNTVVSATPKVVGSSGYGVYRLKLGSGMSGAHTLVSDQPIGIQVMGYGDYTSYQYPGGLDLHMIAPPPIQ